MQLARTFAGPVLALALAIALPRPTDAQGQPSVPAPAPRARVISLNPLGIMFDVYAAEYEQRLARRSTLGAAASYFPASEWSYLSTEGKYRYYPQGAALRGLSVGGTLGVTRIASRYNVYRCDQYGGCYYGPPNESYVALTLGFEMDYQWLLGEKQDFVMAAGLGAKRFVGSRFINQGLDGITKALPVVRLSIGYSF